MKVIYAGYPKTGTKTMNAALTELGFNCYDYLEQFQYDGDSWLKIFKEGGTVDDFRQMFKDADACMDVPSCYFWEEIHKAFPDAKIIFGRRKTEDEWWKSFENQIDKSQSYLGKLLRLLSPACRSMNLYSVQTGRIVFGVSFVQPWFRFCTLPEVLSRKRYRTHNNSVLENAPKDKLLVIDFDKGWEPLCEFLQVPVPSTPFPHKNKNGSIVNDWMKHSPVLKRMQLEAMINGTILFCLFSFGLFKTFRNRSSVWNHAKFLIPSIM